MGCLYKLTSPSGKHYIGITMKTAQDRWSKHVEHALGKRDNGALYSALRKYGPNTFSLEVLVTSDNWGTLCELEKQAIQAFRSLSPTGYNIALGGEGVQGKRSEKDRLKISEAQKKRYQRPEERERLRKFGEKGHAAISAKWKPIREAKQAAQKAYVASDEFKHLHSEATKQAMARPEVKAKTSQAAKKRWQDPAFRAHFRLTRTGKKTKPCSENRRRLVSEARRREWSDPVIRSKRLIGLAKARAAKKSTTPTP